MATDTRSPDRGIGSAIDSALESYHAIPMGRRRLLVRAVSLALVIVLWEFLGNSVSIVLFAPFSDVVAQYIEFVRAGEMYPTLFSTLGDMLVGFALVAAVGVPVGIAMGRSYFLRRILEPWVSALFVVATAALLPLFIVAFGLDFTFRIAIVWFSAIFHVIINVFHGAQGVDENLLQVGNSFAATRLKRFVSIVLPATLPFIISGLRMGLARSLLGIILAEIYIFYGYGGMILEWGRQSTSVAPVLALVLNIMIVAYVLRKSMEWVQFRLAPWAEVDVET